MFYGPPATVNPINQVQFYGAVAASTVTMTGNTLVKVLGPGRSGRGVRH